MPRSAQLLRRPVFARFFLARTISVLGSALGSFALAFAILALPAGSPTIVGTTLGAMAVARIAATLAGGVLGDRFPRSRVLAAGEGLSGVGALGLGLLLLAGDADPGPLAAFAALLGAGAGIFGPALSAMVADVVAPDELRDANGLLRLSTNTVTAGGIALAGALVATTGGAAALLLDALSFLVSMILIASTRTAAVPARGQSLLADLREGWREFWMRPWVVSIVAAAFLINAAWAAIVGVFGPVIARDELGGAPGWAIVTVAGAVGSVAGTVVALRLRPRRPLFVGVLCFAACCALPFAMAARLPVAALAAVLFLINVGLDVFAIGWDTVMQQRIPRAALARVSAYDWLGSTAATPIGLALAGPVLDRLEIHAVLALAGILVLAAGLMPLAVSEVRSMEIRGPAGAAADAG